MNEHGKSDKPIVPEKSSNKVGTSAAEGQREGACPRETCDSKTRSGHSAGETRTVHWSGYGKQGTGASCGSSRNG
jgi:hypothetical protein